MGLLPRTAFTWRLRTRSLDLGGRTLIMGILNVTPDSFFDGGAYFSDALALRHALEMLDDGADIIDLGGESTRPMAVPLTAEEEQNRVLPLLKKLKAERPDVVISIDTYHASTARRAVEAGAEIVNDVSGLTWDPAMAGCVASVGAGVVLTHTRGRPREWVTLPALPPVAVMPVILTGLRDALLAARTAGVPAAKIALDPGLGFGKRGEENFIVLALLEQLRQFGLPVLVGASRKGFLRQALARGGAEPGVDGAASLHGTLAAGTAAILAGAHILRVHDVAAARDAAAVADKVLNAADAVAQATASFARGTSTMPQ